MPCDLLVLGAIAAHLVEIGIFAGGITLLSGLDAAVQEGSQFHPLYYSAVPYTALGGSPLPTRELRTVTAVEALTGLILIAWTASFLFLVMQRAWWERE